MIRVTRRFEFSAGHQLPFHDGQCARPHGHNYILEVTITGAVQDDGPKRGMIIDFKDLDTIVKQEIFSLCDHQDLNKTIGREARPGMVVGYDGTPVPTLEEATGSPETTAEILAQWMYTVLSARLRLERRIRGIGSQMDLMLESVRLSETSNCWVTVG